MALLPVPRFKTATYDEARVVSKGNGGFVAPRADVAASERCYVAFNSGMVGVGFLQEFADGTAAYWKIPMSQASAARSLDEAYERVFVYEDDAVPVVCPKCRHAILVEATAKTGEEIMKCAKCGTEAGKRW